jgi:hypothetical protein
MKPKVFTRSKRTWSTEDQALQDVVAKQQLEGQKLFNYYNEMGYVKTEGNRIKLKEKGVKRNTPKLDIPTADVEKINTFLLSQGYRRIPKENRDDKFVWKKLN